jgi:hypothetical protein
MYYKYKKQNFHHKQRDLKALRFFCLENIQVLIYLNKLHMHTDQIYCEVHVLFQQLRH